MQAAGQARGYALLSPAAVVSFRTAPRTRHGPLVCDRMMQHDADGCDHALAMCDGFESGLPHSVSFLGRHIPKRPTEPSVSLADKQRGIL